MPSLSHSAAVVLREIRGVLADFWVDPTPETHRDDAKKYAPIDKEDADQKTTWQKNLKNFALQEVMWGSGELFPHGAVIAEHLIAPLKIKGTQAFLDLNAGLGTWASTLNQRFGTHFTGLVWNDEIARYRTHCLNQRDESVSSSIEIIPCSQGSLPVLSRRYDGAIARLFFSTLQYKELFIQDLCHHLTPDAQISFVDYTTNPPSSDHDASMPTEDDSSDTLYPITIHKMQEIWEKAGFDLSVIEDVTDNHVLDLCEGLLRLHNYLTEYPAIGDSMSWVKKEITHLERRLHALSTTLRVYRFYGTRNA